MCVHVCVCVCGGGGGGRLSGPLHSLIAMQRQFKDMPRLIMYIHCALLQINVTGACMQYNIMQYAQNVQFHYLFYIRADGNRRRFVHILPRAGKTGGRNKRKMQR